MEKWEIDDIGIVMDSGITARTLPAMVKIDDESKDGEVKMDDSKHERWRWMNVKM